MNRPTHPTAAPPNLKTLHTKPTWHNRAGRVDRSACFTVTAAKLWRLISDDAWTYRYPARQAIHIAKGKCDRFADLDTSAHDLWLNHKNEQPYPLQGDLRTAKTNAMRAHAGCAKITRQTNNQRNTPILGQGPINPNRGVGFSMHKILGLPYLWQSTLTIERYIQHAKLKQHFLVCPVCSAATTDSVNSRRPTDAEQENNAPPLSNPPAHASGARRSPAISDARKKSLPLGRVTKLYLPLCTKREYNDAQLAHLWLTTHPRNTTHPNRPLNKDALQLIERYGELFPTRQLRCRSCLGLRYGAATICANKKTLIFR